jgi:hypothetical protein
MRFTSQRARLFSCSLCLLAIPFLSGCTSKSASDSRETKSTNSPSQSVTGDHFDGGTYCAQTFLQGPPPPQPLHFSNKVIQSDPSEKSKDFEADLSGDTLDIVHTDHWQATDQDRNFFQESQKFADPKIVARSIKNGIAEERITNHFTRSDESGWRGGVMSITQGGTPWSLFLSKPTVKQMGPETVNGYETIKYAVDTTHDSQTDKTALLMASSLKDYNITGNAWVLKDANCVLQYNLDFEQDGKDGKASKTHFEGSVTKK